MAQQYRSCKRYGFSVWIRKIQIFSLEKGKATHSTIPAWRIPRTKESGRLQSIGSQGVRHDWSNLACTHILFYIRCYTFSRLYTILNRLIVQTWKWSESESCSVESNSLRPHGLYRAWNSPGQNTGISSLSLPQGIFPIQGSNPGLPLCRQILYLPEPPGKPKNTGVGSPSLLQGIFPTQGSNRGLMHCRWVLYQLSYQGSPYYIHKFLWKIDLGQGTPWLKEKKNHQTYKISEVFIRKSSAHYFTDSFHFL